MFFRNVLVALSHNSLSQLSNVQAGLASRANVPPCPAATSPSSARTAARPQRRWQGKCEACGEWNTMVEEGDGTGVAGRPAAGRPPRKGRQFALEPLAGETHEAPRLPSRPGRTRPRHRRRLRARLGAADGRRSRHRQVDAADPGRGGAGARRPPRRLHLRRGGGGAGAAARRAARPGRRAVELAAETSVEDIIATLSEGKTPRLVIIDSIQTMWTDAVESRARHGDAGARLGAGADPLCQELRRGRHPGRPRHQGRPDRRPARGRAHGRRGAVVRGRRLAPVPHPARGEEPLRPDRRDRRVRDDRRWACARSPTRPSCSCPSAISARPAPRCSPASRAPGRCWSKSRRWWRRPRSARRAARWSAGTRSRLSMVLAVLEAHCGVKLGGHDVYLNVAGGLRIVEPAADLAAAAALVSSLANAPLPADAVYFGEVSLSGAVRPVAQARGPAEGGAEARLCPRRGAGGGAPEAGDPRPRAHRGRQPGQPGRRHRRAWQSGHSRQKPADKTGDGTATGRYTRARRNRLQRPFSRDAARAETGLKLST